jgi:hypothetical protein
MEYVNVEIVGSMSRLLDASAGLETRIISLPDIIATTA